MQNHDKYGKLIVQYSTVQYEIPPDCKAPGTKVPGALNRVMESWSYDIDAVQRA